MSSDDEKSYAQEMYEQRMKLQEMKERKERIDSRNEHLHELITLFEEKPYKGQISFGLSYADVKLIIDALAAYQIHTLKN